MSVLREKASGRQRVRQIQWPHIAVIVMFLVFVLAAVFVSLLGYLLQLKWTGVTEKTFWHWLGLIIAPVLLSGGGFLLYTLWVWSDHRATATAANEAARHADLDQITQGYLDDIEHLLLRLPKADAKEAELIHELAQARTLTVLQGLDQYRKGSILQFLYAASLIKPKSSEQELSQQPYIRLKGANLRETHLRWVDLENACLSGVDFSYADLREVKLSKADLSGADLGDTLLRRADLKNACLSGVKLSKADFSGADLSSADLSSADLSDAKGITMEQLESRAQSLEGATMPDGSQHP